MNDLRIEQAHWAPADINKTWDATWKKFSSSPVPWIVSSLIYTCIFVVLMVVYFIGVFALANTSPESGSLYDPAAPPATDAAPGIGFFVFIALIMIAFFVVAIMWMANVYRCATHAVLGGELTIGSFFKFERVGGFFVIGLLVGLATFIGTLLCIIPGYIVAIFLGFAQVAFFNIQQPSVGNVFKASIEMVKRNPLASILVLLFCQVIAAVGQLVVFGAVITVPLAALFTTYAFRGSVLGDPVGFGAGGPAGHTGFGGPAGPAGFGGQQPPYPPQQPPYPPQQQEPPYPPLPPQQ